MTGHRHATYLSQSREATVAAGEQLGRLLSAGDVVALNGDLGAGKTALTAGIAAGLGCGGPVSSPTFVLQRTHPAGDRGLRLHHFDLYRLDGPDAFLELGFDEVLDGPDVCVLEWADIASSVLPARTIRITIRSLGEDNRILQVSSGREEADFLSRLAEAFRPIEGLKEENRNHENPGL